MRGMELLLDTCTFLWMITSDERLSERSLELLEDPDNDVFLSAASCWEIAVKHSLGKLELPEDPSDYIPHQRIRHGVDALAVTESATLLVPRLPAIHRDPFDRVLVCQAIDQGFTLLSPDPVLRKYPAKVIW